MARDMPPTRRGYSPYECVSAMQKAIRRSQVRETVYWGYELRKSGYDAWAWARINEILSEDIGHADRYLPATIKALEETSKHKKKTKNSGGLEFVHALILMATARKSRLADWLVMEMETDHVERLEIPDEAYDRHTRAGRAMGRDWPHFIQEGAKLVDPEEKARGLGFDSLEAWLDAIDADSARHFERVYAKDPTLPKNPWRPDAGSAGPQDSWLPEEEPRGNVQTELEPHG